MLRNVTALLVLAGGLLAIFEASNRRLHVLPADASALGVLPAAILVGLVVTLAEAGFRRKRIATSS